MTAWNTGAIADKSMFGPMMVIKLPEGVAGNGFKPPYDDTACHAIMNILHYDYKIEVGIDMIVTFTNTMMGCQDFIAI